MLVQTGDLTPTNLPAGQALLQTYCGLDCCVTLEVLEALAPQAPRAQLIYAFEKELQAPYLEIMLRGWRVNHGQRTKAVEGLKANRAKLAGTLNVLAEAVWDRGLNPASPKQLQEFFYSRMGLPEQWVSQKGIRKISTGREALEKLGDYLHAQPFINTILAIRDIDKQLGVLESEIDPDGRWRTSYNIAGTETGRASSSTNAFGTGGNAQNIAPGLRSVFEADLGYKLIVIDLEQVEARDVGFICGCLFGDWKFLDNCESGDLHTNNAKLIWPGLGWTGDPKRDRKIAEQDFYRGMFSYRDMAKRGGHLSNYSGTAWTAARSLKVPLGVMEEFQARYIRGRSGHKTLPPITPAFPAIPKWWQWVATQLQTSRQLTTLFGRQRFFFGRPDDPATLREAIAFGPQGTTADRMNLGIHRIWKREPTVQLLGNGFDSVIAQAPDNPGFDDLVGRMLEHIKITLVAPNGRKYLVPGEAKVGWNWGYGGPNNLEGIVKWRPGGETRVRRFGLDQTMLGGR